MARRAVGRRAGRLLLAGLCLAAGCAVALTTGLEGLRLAAPLRQHLEAALRSLQFPPQRDCGCRRILMYTGHYYEGFACAVHQMGLALLVALATNRTLVVPATDHWGYVSGSDCSSRSWDCVFEPISSCSEAAALRSCGRTAWRHSNTPAVDSMQELAVIEGPARVVELLPRGSTSKHGSVHRMLFAPDVLQGPLGHWLAQAGGVFRLRAEVQMWLWRPQLSFKQHTEQMVEILKRQQGLRGAYLAAHIRASDNLENTKRDFGIHPSTYSVPSFLPRLQSLDSSVQRQLRGQVGHRWPGKMPVFIATDSTAVISHLQRWQNLHGSSASLRFVFDKGGTSRAPGKDQVLHKANRKDRVPRKQVLHLTRDIVATITLLSHATALVGSQISNVFRLATELHCAFSDYLGCDLLLSGQDGNSTTSGTVRTVDVPWYQDP